MAPAFSDLWQALGPVTHVLGAIASVAGGIWLVRQRERFAPAGAAIVAALLTTAVWCIVAAAIGAGSMGAALAEAIRNLAWLWAVYRLFMADGRHESLAPIRPVMLAVAFVELLHLGLDFVIGRIPAELGVPAAAFDLIVLFRLLVAVGALVLVHNLYAGASRQSRAAIRWPAAGLAVLWTFDLNLYAIAYVSGEWPAGIAAARGLAAAVLAAMLVAGASKNIEEVRLKPSRAVTFQTFSLLVIGLYLVAMVAVARWLTTSGDDLSRFMQIGFLSVAGAIALLVVPSQRMRRWFKVVLAKHLFQHRYDYREEWLRFTRTIGKTGLDAQPLGERVVKAVCDIADSPGGLLLSPGEHGDLVLAARWNWPDIEVPANAFPARSLVFFEREAFITDLVDIRAGKNEHGEMAHVPDWLREDARAWALVPLIHFERLVGMVVLAQPPMARSFDWEDFDLLRVVGRQLASYLAENASQEALAEASRFDDFHRRIAFVMHDIKNLASQLSLLARNAELHADKKEFRDDMLVTLRNSADKLNALIARLSRYGNGAVERLEEICACDVVRAVKERFRAHPQVLLAECEDIDIRANSHSLEQVLVHLVQNAIDASEPDAPVFLGVRADGLNARFEVIDSGCGMSPEFVRTRLFKPFDSTKSGGFGIGAFEARELVRAMRGRVEVESREGLGSRFIVRIPLAAASSLYDNLPDNEQEVA
jgi:putative PEP-CTERM system histidine kinase